jgi:protein O-GlcNAc transferase
MSEQQQTLTIQQAIDLAVQHHTAGRLPQAETIYQQILQADPNQPVALHLLGVIAHQMGKNDAAVDRITKALTIKPESEWR